MGKKKLFVLFCIFAFYAPLGCATTPTLRERLPIPLKEAHPEAVFEENEGLEVIQENAKELRDFYRGGVQQKVQAEKKFKEKAYPEALKLYRLSNEFFSTILQHLDEDSAEYHLFEETSILFFPNLLVADNHLKMGLIHQAAGREGPAQRHWKRALSFVARSLKAESTEWGLALQQELLTLSTSGKK